MMIPLPQPQSPTYKRPCEDLLKSDRRIRYIDTCVPLYKAIMEGNWDTATDILRDNDYLLRYSITENQETPLHIAAMAPQSTTFVQYLVEKMEVEELELRNGEGNTALCLAAITGNVKMAMIMVERNLKLLSICGSQGMMPLHLAALYRNHKMVTYLYNQSHHMSSDGWTEGDRNRVLLKCIEVDLFDIALRIVNDNTHLPQGRYEWEVLHALARKPYAFDDIEPHIIWKIICSIFGVVNLNVGIATEESEAMQLLKLLWGKVVVKSKTEIDEILRGPMVENKGTQTYPSRILFAAAETGNAKFLVELIHKYPDLLWKRIDNGQTIFHVAVSHRRESIYRLLYDIGSMKDLITPLVDKEGNNILHLVGMNAKKNPYGEMLTAPFQMQRELLWFKEIKAMIPGYYREAKNTAGQTPAELFTDNHKDLVSQSKKWMKGTINQCMVAAVLIATIGFSVAWTVPGGYNQQNGFPQFLHDGHLIAFVIFDAISFILSSISILMFLSIVVSRYTQTDFLESLPQKLTIGLTTLFLSILTMMVAFGVSFFILYHDKLMLVPFIVWALGSVPVLIYSKLQYPLLVDVFHSRYGSRYLFKSKIHMLYQNPKF